MACSGDTPNSPGTSREAADKTPAGFTISNAVLASPSRNQSAAAREPSGSAYLSAAPNTFAGDADQVSIRNETSRAPAVIASLINGGFDPVGIEGQEGDDVSVSLFHQGGLLSVSYVKIPPRRPPRIVRTTPDKGRIDVALDITIEVVFTEPIDKSTIASSLRLLRNGEPVAGIVRVSANGLIAEFDPETALESNTLYTLTLTQGLRDLDGDELAEPALVEFRTGNAPPQSGPIVPELQGMLAFVSDRDGNPEIYTSNADGTDLRRLTNNANADFDPAWSADGKRIAFARSTQPVLDNHLLVSSDIYVMDADGSNVVQITAGGINSYPTWSPDGRRIAYQSTSNNTRIVVIDLQNPLQPLETVSYDRGWNTNPAWSPDGKTILFASDWYAFDFATLLFAAKTDGSSSPPVDFPLPYPDNLTTYYYLQPSWSPDGTRVAFAECDYFYICWGTGWIVIANADASGYRRLTSAINIESTTWSPDGTTIAYSSGTSCHPSQLCSPNSISYVTLDGRKGLILTNAYSPSWRPSPR